MSASTSTSSTSSGNSLRVDRKVAADWLSSSSSSSSDATGTDPAASASRFYHPAFAQSASTYALPSDEPEKNRLHMQHIVTRACFGGIFHTPQHELFANPPHEVKVLDVGCGPGSWTLEMAKSYPKTSFIGMDVAEYEHTDVPSNATFQTGDILRGLDFPDNTFDFVFQRYLLLGIPADRWPWVIQELIRVTKPAGYIQLFEMSLKYFKFNSESTESSEELVDGPLAKLMGAS
ncbi:hypothetical protein HK405_005881 [Cladochytrium tenue]|nr:hypothetical protein HK405_005881 [Cladochytrium tenue]